MGECVERKVGELTVRIQRGTCIGTGNCMKLAPEVFEFDAEKIVAFRAEAGDVERERLVEACQACPVDALFVLDPTGTQLVP